MKNTTDKFYFKKGHLYDVATLGKTSIDFKHGNEALKGNPNGFAFDITLDPMNVKSLVDFAKAIIKKFDNFNALRSDDVMSKIRTKYSGTKYLYEYISFGDVCVVEFESEQNSPKEFALIGDYIKHLSGEDCVILSNDSLEFDNMFNYDLTSIGIGKAAKKYFLAVHNKVVTNIQIVSNPFLLDTLKTVLVKN